ncbi:hypothetical protein BJ508DRAFT_340213 [Ascobolus immersus RN42]|uniref:Uncharacterized protein n=1 Tax=Ascobolus immersus RN42 TaxID=1160509 RepID=A0A3N4HMD0_ASCIM|nr:hypothetical protein BJ508DRAFT_340213 [Ascobolus immersus RN42]
MSPSEKASKARVLLRDDKFRADEPTWDLHSNRNLKRGTRSASTSSISLKREELLASAYTDWKFPSSSTSLEAGSSYNISWSFSPASAFSEWIKIRLPKMQMKLRRESNKTFDIQDAGMADGRPWNEPFATTLRVEWSLDEKLIEADDYLLVLCLLAPKGYGPESQEEVSPTFKIEGREKRQLDNDPTTETSVVVETTTTVNPSIPTSAPHVSSNPQGGKPLGLSPFMLGGIIAGGVGGLLLIFIVAFILMRIRKRRRTRSAVALEEESEADSSGSASPSGVEKEAAVAPVPEGVMELESIGMAPAPDASDGILLEASEKKVIPVAMPVEGVMELEAFQVVTPADRGIVELE